MDSNLIVYPLFLASINFLCGYMVANLTAYAKFKLVSSNLPQRYAEHLKILGVTTTLGVSLFCSALINSKLQYLWLDTFSLVQVGIIASAIALISSASLLGYILTLKLINRV